MSRVNIQLETNLWSHLFCCVYSKSEDQISQTLLSNLTVFSFFTSFLRPACFRAHDEFMHNTIVSFLMRICLHDWNGIFTQLHFTCRHVRSPVAPMWWRHVFPFLLSLWFVLLVGQNLTSETFQVRGDYDGHIYLFSDALYNTFHWQILFTIGANCYLLV